MNGILPKRIAALVLGLGLALSACGGGGGIGSELDPSLRAIEESKSPTPTRSRPKRETKKPTPTQSAVPTKVNTWKLKIDNVGDGFEPDSINALESDKIVFTNKDPDNKHQLVIHQGDKELKAGPLLSTGQSWSYTIKLEPGQYGFRDGAVPYIVGGILFVNQRP